MNFNKFKEKYRYLPYIRTQGMGASFDKTYQAMLNQLTRWQDKGLIIQLKRGFYILNKHDRKIFPSRFFFANQLMWPSYVSMESALSHYGFIPEAVADITSITSKKTNCFDNKLGRFIYQHLKPGVFNGYHSFKDEAGMDVFIADPEKAIVDFLYLNLNKFKAHNKDIFSDSYRFQNTQVLNCRKIILLSKLFKNSRLEAAARLFCEFVKDEKDD